VNRDCRAGQSHRHTISRRVRLSSEEGIGGSECYCLDCSATVAVLQVRLQVTGTSAL